MPRKRIMEKKGNDHLHGVWTLAEFSEASPYSYGWWRTNILNYPEIKKFSNWDKDRNEKWAFDAAEANKWLLNKFVYKGAKTT